MDGEPPPEEEEEASLYDRIRLTTMDAGVPPFLSKTYDMVDDPSTDSLVSWANNTFVVWDVPQFSTLLLPKYFKHSNFSSFVRQLNTYGFRKVDPDRWEFANEGFLKGHKHLLKNIVRRKPSHAQQWQPQTSPVVENMSVPSCGDAGGKFGIEGEVDMLKNDKNILMQELVRLRQQQQSTDHQLQTVGQRVHTMEQRQQQMMSFLAKAMHTPSFMSQLVHQQNDGNRQISDGNKKRRLPSEDEDNLAHKYSITSPDGQVVKYQPLMNEAAKALLRQILVMNNSSRIESKLSDLNAFLIDNGESSSSRMSAMTVSEVVTSTASVQSSAMLAQENDQRTFLPKTKAGTSNFAPERNTCLPESTNARHSDSIPGFIDAPMPVASDELVGDDGADILLDDVYKLPGINDTFWEQFLSKTPLEEDNEEVNSAANMEHGNVGMDLKMDQETEWDNLKNLNNLTEQLALIASVSQNG